MTATYGADGTGTELFKTSAKVSKCAEDIQFYYDQDAATKIRLTYSGTGYTHSTIKIDYSADIAENMVTGMAESGAIKEGETLDLKATVSTKYLNTMSTPITWQSSSPTVAEVSNDGIVTGKSAGTAIITATCGIVSKTCNVEVAAKPVGNPVAGETYTYNLCDSSNLKASGSTEDGFFAWSDANPGSGHGLQGGKGTLKVAGNVKITLGFCQYGSGTMAIKEGTKVLTSMSPLGKSKEGGTLDCCAKGKTPVFDNTTSISYNYTVEAAELSLEWDGNVYFEGIKVEPLTN